MTKFSTIRKKWKFFNMIKCIFKKITNLTGTSLVAQWLRLHCQCRGPASAPWSGNHFPPAATKSSHATAKDTS